MPKRSSTCKIYKSCAAVPTGKSMNGCTPAYTSKGSKNWTKCNMSHYFPGFAHYKQFCKSQKTCKHDTYTKPTADQVDVKTLHNKMPYIWRRLDKKTRRKIVQLARKPLSKINI
jgi:hypothetical protein